jgi:ornithine carbamoyltransferase
VSTRHFLSLFDLTREELLRVLQRATELKQLRARGQRPQIFQHRVLAMIFEKASTRTRVSFEAAMAESGGTAIFLSPGDTQLGRGEPVEDTARVLSRMCDAVMARTFSHDTIERLAAAADIPVINALTDRLHPCQVLADLQTFREHRGDITGRKVAWVGDGNNMCNTYIEAAQLFGFELAIATPREFQPRVEDYLKGEARLLLTQDPAAAVADADLVVTDVWISMGHESEAAARLECFKGYQVNANLMSKAKPDALFMHCLPAHRGEEVSAEVLDHPQSVVWDEAGNRLHAQKALLDFLING